MTLRILLLTALGISSSLSQVYTPPKPPAQPAQPNTPQDSVRPAPASQPAPGPIGQEMPFFNPSSETITWNGSTWAATDNRLFASRFEGYLSQPADDSEAAEEYRQTIEAILEATSPTRPGGPDISAAVKLLPMAATYPGDSKICDSLLNAVYTAWLAKRNVGDLKNMMKGLEDERTRIIKRADWKARTEQDNRVNEGEQVSGEQGNRNQGQSKGATQEGRGVQSLQYIEYTRRLTEIDALKKKLETEGTVNIVQSKIQYQALMAQLFLQRRFQHVVMASRFYNEIYGDGDSKLRIKKNSELGKVFAQDLGVSPTVSTLDSMANEAIRDVDAKVEGFKYLLARGDLDSAAKRLSEAFVVGEFLPSIRTLKIEKKQEIRDYARMTYKLLGALEVRDYTTAQTLVDSLKEMAKDFDGTKAMQAINTYTTQSNLHLAKARNLMLAGREDEATAQIQKSMEIWPNNPGLKELSKVYDQENLMTKARQDLRRLRDEGNYREIFEQRGRFTAAAYGDPELTDLMEQIGSNITIIESTIRTADQLRARGNSYAAWEMLIELRNDDTFAQDPILGQRIVDLTPEVNDFVVKLKQGDEHSARGDKASALSHYLQAQSLYQGSELAKEKIDKLVDEMLGRPSTAD